MRPFIVIVLLTATIAAANAFGLGLGNRFGRLGASGQAGAVSPPPVGCSGIIDASAGCPLPMLGM